ncbi:hypothetical protein SAMN02745124_01975 [Desulfofustis glycolicus DSM 9705]|uniref:Uncharacterized protein n=1 Tax=Desulfofustis glycolicus DSM 9705 TaxID=1121409 RepID=A0A1M5VZ87_9BACT|nr:hypothetical protein SAMN02745124_01975 [Desulfofustis glycolicus DSM 9705]
MSQSIFIYNSVIPLKTVTLAQYFFVYRIHTLSLELICTFFKWFSSSPEQPTLSPLLADILLDDLDKELEQRGYRFS